MTTHAMIFHIEGATNQVGAAYSTHSGDIGLAEDASDCQIRPKAVYSSARSLEHCH
jgi:hypothetical protein